MSLSTKELLLIQDNVKMTQNTISFCNSVAQNCTDAQVKTLCQQMTTDHQRDVEILLKYVNTVSLQ